MEFFAAGQPVPQGSMKVINGHVIHSRGSALAVWRATIALAAKDAGIPKREEGAVALTMTFTLPRPKTVKREHPTVPPDLDKLVRSVLDALTGVAYRDDSQVTGIYAAKRYGDEVGVRVWIDEM